MKNQYKLIRNIPHTQHFVGKPKKWQSCTVKDSKRKCMGKPKKRKCKKNNKYSDDY